MICETVLITRDGSDSTVVAVVENDVVFGDVGRLQRVMEAEGYLICVEEGSLALAEWRKKRMVDRFAVDVNANPRVIQVIDVNRRCNQQLLEMTEFVLWLGEQGIVPWDAILDGCFNRWVMQDIRDKVSLGCLYLGS